MKPRKMWLWAALVVVVLALALPVIVQAQEQVAPSRVEEIRAQIVALRRELVQELQRTGELTEQQAERILERLDRTPGQDGFRFRPDRAFGRGGRGCPCGR